MSYQTDREEFIATTTREGLPLTTIRALLRAATVLHRLALAQTNDKDADPRAFDRKADAVRRILKGHRIKPLFDDDPRGAVLKLQLPSGRTDDWAQSGLCVPAKLTTPRMYQ